MAEITFYNIPMIAIEAECLARCRFNLYEAGMFKTSLFQPKSLTASTSTNFY